MSAEQQFISSDAAIAMLPDRDRINTFRQTGIGLLGADWDRTEIVKAIENGKPQLAGETAMKMGHALVISEIGSGPLFIETKQTPDQTNQTTFETPAGTKEN